MINELKKQGRKMVFTSLVVVLRFAYQACFALFNQDSC